ncbi:BglG family transcription antiterminator [Bacillus sp. CECT 9360]|uniref:BglG family transcription antiterminator n=1 Tax=Bacillus sp. CECT 9360 TaxID=2845821 RepID=UPI001E3E28D8|nr:BglG family transcription antiterminator [Bacillus sp. CECT 9360]CAH0345846.1 Transcriptional regulator MtlR [Bacillus sp. CECT 9360]
MYISARERIMLEILLDKSEEMTVKDLADDMDVSVRTIHRDLKGLESTLKDYELQLVKKSGVGIQIIGEEDKAEELKLALLHVTYSEYTPDERQTMILCALLESREPVKLVAISNDLNVTIATISNDLTKLENRLHELDLSLIRKRGYGVEIVGSETAKRKAMRAVIAENLNEVEFLSLVKENIQKKSTKQIDSISERLLGLVEKNKLFIVEKAIEEVNTEISYSMADSAYIGLVVHLALAIERIIQGENINIDQDYLEGLQSVAEYKMAKKIIRKLEKAFNIDIPDAEIGYITMHLQGAKLRHDKEYLLEDSSLQIAIKAKSLIKYVEEQLQIDLLSNASLFQGLVTHLKPALFRVKQNMGIANPLMQKIKQDYGDLFNIVKGGVSKVFLDLIVPDEEIAYLVMHFGSALGKTRTADLKALVICSTGIGTSKMLATRLKQELPEIGTLTNVSLFELNRIQLEEYDLVISTINLPAFDKEHIVVSPILTKEEINRLRNYIDKQTEDHARTRKVPLADIDFPVHQSAEQLIMSLRNLSQYTDTIATVLEGFSVMNVSQFENMEGILARACEYLNDSGVIEDPGLVKNALLEREKLGGLGIPGTRLALFHARSDQVLRPSFNLLALEDSLSVKAMDQTDIETDSILLLLSPETFSSQGLEVLSFISSIIIENEHSIALFESKNANSISSYLAANFEQFFNGKLKEMRND